MRTDELDFSFPQELVATERREPSRVLLSRAGQPRELAGGVQGLLELFAADDVLVINDTRVLSRRVFAESGLEILFIKRRNGRDWEVLCPARRWKKDTLQSLPEGVQLELVQTGLPQIVRADRDLDEAYFLRVGELPLPPYIQEVRGERHMRATDREQYQTHWAKADGSLAAPTASLHFMPEHLAQLRARGVQVLTLTLHVGLGTFLPVQTDDVEAHSMHAELCEIPLQTWQACEVAKNHGHKVWALGSTVTRSLEAAAAGRLERREGALWGENRLYIYPPYEFKMVDVLLTNFHQPRTTLLAMVAAFAGGLGPVRATYQFAIENKFRLFSYGDLSVWMK